MNEIILDVQDLPAPEPLQTILSNLGQIVTGSYIKMIHRREPCMLFDKLDQKGYYWRTGTTGSGKTIVLICLRDDSSICNLLAKADIAGML